MSLRCINLTKTFFSFHRKTVAIEKMNVEIQPMEFFVLLGPSGCGKSTLLNLLAGIENPTEGEIWFGNKLFSSADSKYFLSPRERNVAMVFQNYALYPHLTVFDNIAFPMRIKGVGGPELEHKVKEAASLLKLESLLSSKPRELSGGQRQRVAIARAIIRQPNLFLLDEPLSNLDAQLRISTRMELKKLQRKLKITTVYVTHDQIEAMTLGDRVALIREGKIEQIGKPEELYENPVNSFVGTFIGSPTMNLLNASLVVENGVAGVNVCNTKIKIPQSLVERCHVLKSDNFMLGIRPEHIKLASSSTPETIAFTVIGIEKLGREILIYGENENNKITFLTYENGLCEGDVVSVLFNVEKMHIFPVSHK